MKKYLFVLLVLVLLVAQGCAKPANEAENPEQPLEMIELKAVSAWQKNSTEHDGYWIFMDKVKEKLGDRITIKYVGGPEVFPYEEQAQLLGQGAFDILETNAGGIAHLVPEAYTFYVTRMTAWEEREKGIHDVWREIFEKKLNITFMGNTGSGDCWSYQVYSNKKIENIDDFKGKTFRIAMTYDPLFEALKAGRVVMPAGDVFTAMERGTVDGFAWTTLAVTDYGWSDVTKYIVKPAFYDVKVSMFFNTDRWNSLPEDIRVELMKIVEETEKDAYQHFSSLVEEEEKKLLEAGMEIIELAPAEAEKYLKIADDAMWDRALKESPEYTQKIKNLVYR